ncbi:SusF/SusE family outer membrane protein [Sphingobacterium sp. SRCM116780]|uniref:SusF/SusE family outer membrane protein n=1 Tax=Sphingobacterium sp. SRCM116780 TaxID=2907623 RepID=UPI001F46E66E|nr:SusF/SusE family outer membrane protein [Sphingobacterium sp. SRCM116780]UIR56408.1 SusF/SusE family outer membrane protein [Sphingobacterium sp. SRCM116780]
MFNIFRLLLVLLVGVFSLLFSCKKVEHGIDDAIVSINENTVSTIQVGKKLKVGFIANQITEFTFSIVPVNGTEALITENITVDPNTFIASKEFDIPNEASWIGDALLKVTYTSGGQTIEKTKPITFTESNPQMFVVGGSIGAGWEPTLGVPMRLYDEDSKFKFETFEYITVDGSGFKFLPTNVDWTDAFGKGATEGTLLQSGDAGNITVAADGFYRIRMDAEAKTYELLKSTWGVIGSATPKGWDADTDMTFAGGKGTYTWKVKLNLVAGELKFRMNDDWAVNMGGTVSALQQDGANLVIDAAGTYDVELNLTPGGYTAKISKN